MLKDKKGSEMFCYLQREVVFSGPRHLHGKGGAWAKLLLASVHDAANGRSKVQGFALGAGKSAQGLHSHDAQGAMCQPSPGWQGVLWNPQPCS